VVKNVRVQAVILLYLSTYRNNGIGKKVFYFLEKDFINRGATIY